MVKRSQIVANMIIYPLFEIIAVIILVFGYKSIKTLNERGEEAKLLQLKTNLRNDIVSIASRYGSTGINEYSLPLNIGEACFVDLSINTKDSISSGLKAKSPIIANQIEDETKNNVYIRKEKEYPSYRIRLADLFARGVFIGLNYKSIIIREEIKIQNEVKKISKI